MIHVYYGDGKGKTSASTGLAVRAAGRGMKVFMVRFMKTDDSGEVLVLKGIENIIMYPCLKSFGFTFQMTPEQKQEAKKYYTEVFRKVTSEENIKEYDMIVMDEINVVCHYGFVGIKEVVEFLNRSGKEKEIVMTGRYAPEELRERADYVTELRKEKHPFDMGVNARKGIEY